ncbi:hypothetical protein M9458_015093, partial [Cirrhinus mrigala]
TSSRGQRFVSNQFGEALNRGDPEKLEAVLAGAGGPPDPDCMEKTQGQRALHPAAGYRHPPASSG